MIESVTVMRVKGEVNKNKSGSKKLKEIHGRLDQLN